MTKNNAENIKVEISEELKTLIEKSKETTELIAKSLKMIAQKNNSNTNQKDFTSKVVEIINDVVYKPFVTEPADIPLAREIKKQSDNVFSYENGYDIRLIIDGIKEAASKGEHLYKYEYLGKYNEVKSLSSIFGDKGYKTNITVTNKEDVNHLEIQWY